MTEIINFTEGMMDLLMKIEGKRRRRFVPEHICYRGCCGRWSVEIGREQNPNTLHTYSPSSAFFICFFETESLYVSWLS